MAGKDTNIGAKRAREAREETGLDADAPLACLLELVEETLGLPVVVAALPEGVAGVCWRGGGERVVLWVNGTEPVTRRRFTLAHELGHVRCGHDHGLPVETWETLGGRTTDSREVQANAFAAQLLVPADGIRAMVGRTPTLEDVVRLAAHFAVHPIVVVFRLNTLQLVDAERSRRLQEEINQNLDEQLAAQLGLPELDDAMAAVDAGPLPRLSPQLAGSGLDVMARRMASVEGVAAASGCDPGDLARAAATIGI